MIFFVKLRKLHLQTFWKFNTLLEINKRIGTTTKKSTFATRFSKKLNPKQKIFVLSRRNTSQEKVKAVSHGPITWVDGNVTVSPFERPYSVRTHRRNALISVGKKEELKSTGSKKKFSLEWVTTCARRVGESRQPWASVCLRPNVFFSKSIKGKILNFLHDFEKMISVPNLCQSLIEKIEFPFLKKKDLIFKRQN